MSKHICETCGKEYKSRSGLWKHQKKMGHGKFANVPVQSSSPVRVSESPTIQGSSDKPPILEAEDGIHSSPETEPHQDTETKNDWQDFDFGTTDKDSTDIIPLPLKAVVNKPIEPNARMSKAQAKALKTQNTAILKMGLTTIDSLLTTYGRATTLDKEFEVKHSEGDKDLVANAQYAYLEEKGLFLTNYLSTGVIAGTLTAWYVGKPLNRIRKNRKKQIAGNLVKRLPLIGRLFRRKKPKTTEIGQEAEDLVSEYVE